MDFLQGLLDGVVHFRQIDLGYDVESIVRHGSMTQCYQDALRDFMDHGRQGGIERQSDGGANPLGIDFELQEQAGGLEHLRAARRGRRGGQDFGKKPARQLRLLHQRMDGLHHLGGFERLLENRVAAGPLGFFFVERFEQSGSQDHTHMPQVGIAFHVAAEFESGFAGKKYVGQDQIRIDIGQPQQSARRHR